MTFDFRSLGSTNYLAQIRQGHLILITQDSFDTAMANLDRLANEDDAPVTSAPRHLAVPA